MIEKGAIPFTYVPGQGELLSDVFDSEVTAHEVVEPNVVQSSLLSTSEDAGTPELPQFVVGGAAEEQSAYSSTGKTLAVSKTATAVTNSTEVADQAVTATATSSLDMYEDFLGKLTRVLGAAPLTDEQIAISLRLEKAQAKVWLKRALEDGHVEKLKNPVRYSLRLQSSLLG